MRVNAGRDNAAQPTQAWSVALQLLGASAGLIALVTFVGGAMLWTRFDRLDLAADQSVARLPKPLLIVVGSDALLGPVLVGLAVLLFLTLLAPLEPDGSVRRRFWVAITLVGLAAIVVVAALTWQLDLFPEQLVMGLATLAGIAVLVAVALQVDRVRYIAWAVFGVFAVCGAVLSIVRTSGDPRMEPVAVLLSDDGRRGLSGFFVGETADRLLIAPLPGSGDPGDPFADAQIDRIVSLSRDEVARLAMREPVGIEADDPGREQAQTLLAELQQSVLSKRTEVVTTLNPAVAFAPLVHLHSSERLFPMSARGFLDNASLAWSHDQGCRDYVLALDDHVAKPERRQRASAGRLRHGRRLADARLGTASGLRHTGADKRCREGPGPGYTTADHTRPHDQKARPAGLAVKEGFYLDLRDEARVGHNEPDREGAQTVLRDVPVYFEADADEATGRLRITYWLFYGLSRPPPADITGPIAHEGDWERISVLLRRGDRPDRYIPLSVRYHFHDESRDVPWYAVKRVAAGGPEVATHPVVFSARGSHASYPRAGRYANEFRFRGRRRFAVYDDAIACPRCPQWQTWKLSIDARSEPWYGFGGAWGKVGAVGGTTGPLGPSPLKTRGRETPPEQTVGSRSPVPRADEVEEELEER